MSSSVAETPAFYHNDPNFLVREVLANNVGPDLLKEHSDQGLHCLLFCLYRLDSLLYGKTTLFKF